MSHVKHQVVWTDGEATLINVFHDNEIYTAVVGHHPNFEQILDKISEGDVDESITDLFDVQKSVNKRFNKVTGRVSVSNGEVYFDGNVVDNSLTKMILKFVEAGKEDFRPLARFMEKVMDNPSDRSRSQLYDWLRNHGMTINSKGNIIAYKGVRVDVDGQFTSINTGPALVDGVEVNGYVPNPVGATVEIDREYVDDDPNAACSTGLHVGNFRYAESFAQGAILKVEVDPVDWVSVPHDSYNEKGRVCKYTVLDVVDGPINDCLDPDENTVPVTVSKVDTRQNHKTQKRGPNGRFLPKNS